MSQDRLDRAAVLSLQALVVIEPRLDLLEAPRLSLQAVDVAAEVRAQVLGLEPQGAQPLGQRVELRIHPVHGIGEPLGLGQS